MTPARVVTGLCCVITLEEQPRQYLHTARLLSRNPNSHRCHVIPSLRAACSISDPHAWRRRSYGLDALTASATLAIHVRPPSALTSSCRIISGATLSSLCLYRLGVSEHSLDPKPCRTASIPWRPNPMRIRLAQWHSLVPFLKGILVIHPARPRLLSLN